MPCVLDLYNPKMISYSACVTWPALTAATLTCRAVDPRPLWLRTAEVCVSAMTRDQPKRYGHAQCLLESSLERTAKSFCEARAYVSRLPPSCRRRRIGCRARTHCAEVCVYVWASHPHSLKLCVYTRVDGARTGVAGRPSRAVDFQQRGARGGESEEARTRRPPADG